MREARTTNPVSLQTSASTMMARAIRPWPTPRILSWRSGVNSARDCQISDSYLIDEVWGAFYRRDERKINRADGEDRHSGKVEKRVLCPYGRERKAETGKSRNANLAAWYSFDPSNIWWLMDGVKHPQSRAPSAGLKKLSCCFRFIWQSARGSQVFTMLNCCQHLVSLPNLILDALCRHPGVLSSSERPGHRRGCHLYEHPPVMTAHHQHLTDTDGSAYYVYRRPVQQEYWLYMCPLCPKPTRMVLSQRLGLTRTLATWAWTHKGTRAEGVESHFQWIHPKRGQGYMSRRGTYGSRIGGGQ